MKKNLGEGVDITEQEGVCTLLFNFLEGRRVGSQQSVRTDYHPPPGGNSGGESCDLYRELFPGMELIKLQTETTSLAFLSACLPVQHSFSIRIAMLMCMNVNNFHSSFYVKEMFWLASSFDYKTNSEQNSSG